MIKEKLEAYNSVHSFGVRRATGQPLMRGDQFNCVRRLDQGWMTGREEDGGREWIGDTERDR